MKYVMAMRSVLIRFYFNGCGGVPFTIIQSYVIRCTMRNILYDIAKADWLRLLVPYHYCIRFQNIAR